MSDAWTLVQGMFREHGLSVDDLDDAVRRHLRVVAQDHALAGLGQAAAARSAIRHVQREAGLDWAEPFGPRPHPTLLMITSRSAARMAAPVAPARTGRLGVRRDRRRAAEPG